MKPPSDTVLLLAVPVVVVAQDLAGLVARLDNENARRTDDDHRYFVVGPVARRVVRDHNVALGKVLREIRRGAVGERRRGTQPQREGESMHPEGERRDRDEREEELGELAVETERPGGYIEAERIRDRRGTQSEGHPEEASPQRATPMSPG